MYKEAIDDFTVYLKHEPRNAKAHYDLAVCYDHLHDREDAMINFEKAKQLGYADDPDNLKLNLPAK